MLLVNTGSDVNMIKLSELKKDILVNESTIYKLTGINPQPVFTIGSVTLRVQLGTHETIAIFQVIHDNFPISEAGILGAPFLRDNEINLNFRTSTLSLEPLSHSEHPEPQRMSPTLTIQPRSETLVPVLTDKEDGTILVIHAQNIGEKGILLGNVVNRVMDGQIVVSIINPSEDSVEFSPPQLGGVHHDVFKESSVHLCKRTEEQKIGSNRITKLTETIQTDHLNHEERYISFRAGAFTTAIQHDIKIPERATLPYLYEIETNHRNMLLSLRDKDTGKTRVRRGLVHTVQRVVNVLYGIYSNIDTEFIFNKILTLSQSKNQNITLHLERMRIMRVETDQVKEISQHQEKLEGNLQYLQKQTEVINRIEFKARLLEQALLFEILLNQYSYQTQNLMSIINSAMNGKIHTSVFTSERLLMELREIKMNLSVGTGLPLDIEPKSLTELLQISDLTIFHQEHYLVFSIGIPLTSGEEYTMYHPISLPIQYDENTIALISPEVDYLALSNDDENFISFGVNQWESCVKLGTNTLCKGDQPIHYRTGSNLCELSHLTSSLNPLKDCRVKLVTMETPIWHRLSKANSWLYYTKPDLCMIMCTDPPGTFRVEISGVGRLTASPSCEIHTGSSILVPFSKTNRNLKLDVIPENRRFKIKSMLIETLSSVLAQNLTNSILYHYKISIFV
ncbi:hypothetical protein AGLY_016475 [Aphis glycines]|uniref:Peptidase A2 domain-containing protein n=1 Tax=Aphis glycines TaxID=307491 RepID=A0A6G0SYU9_APHGL|nr:hypothetical protein AGLY_016475 [Aphis glycines]